MSWLLGDQVLFHFFPALHFATHVPTLVMLLSSLTVPLG